MDDSRQEARALTTIEAFWAAYEASSPEYFDFFTDDAAIFSVSYPTRLSGREAYRRYFGAELLGQKRAVQILHPEARRVGEGVLVTQHVRFRINYRSVDSRVTFLLVSETEGDLERLMIAHMHMSPLASAVSPETAGMVEDVVSIGRGINPSPASESR